MSDEDLRELERRWQACGPPDATPYLAALIRAGEVTPREARLAWRISRVEELIRLGPVGGLVPIGRGHTDRQYAHGVLRVLFGRDEGLRAPDDPVLLESVARALIHLGFSRTHQPVPLPPQDPPGVHRSRETDDALSDLWSYGGYLLVVDDGYVVAEDERLALAFRTQEQLDALGPGCSEVPVPRSSEEVVRRRFP